MSRWPVRRKKKIIIRYFAAVLFVLVLLPLLIFFFLKGDEKIQIEGDTIKINLLVQQNGKILELGLEEYIVGVVAAEMPASFPPEALKAQAVAARTYAVKRLQVPDPRIKNINLKADLSSDPAINQAWISANEMKDRWGSLNYNIYRRKIIRVVNETKGKVLIYGGQLIDPVYHASCGGCGTENSEDVWKEKIPYLRRVECSNHPDGNKEAVQVFSLTGLSKMLSSLPVMSTGTPSGNSGTIQIKEKTASGRVKSLLWAGRTISGTEFRTKLGLPSTIFEIKNEGDSVKITTRGYGHGVGMCQYGAAAMAREGKTYLEILKYYYQGVTMASLKSG